MHWTITQVQYASTARRIRTALSQHITHVGQAPYLCDKQGELEHRTSKARFRRTDKKQFVKQMAGIERCEAQIRYIRNLNNPSPLGTSVDERVATTPDAHFHIGKSQNSPENVMIFLHKHSEDPAIKVSLSHLLSHPAVYPL